MKEKEIQARAERFAASYKETDYYELIVASYKNGYIDGAGDMIKEIHIDNLDRAEI